MNSSINHLEKQSTLAATRHDRAAARASYSTFGSFFPKRPTARSHCATAQSQFPVLVALCRHHVAARLCTCHHTYRAPTRYPCASSRWHELLSTRFAFTGVRPRALALATTWGPKLSKGGPKQGVRPRFGAVRPRGPLCSIKSMKFNTFTLTSLILSQPPKS
ncbi:hypothetical protein PIB30_086478 [Stylosanthes scabra]|uniref:Uncharacterized protein n=1 Tax=Stylosanthes scabra TaxID=79078 RepID=A0ABU6WRH9_9FABA|nr:hypothetical protein [Stylosanthes scabra]